jgi:Ala-tRNA(Pro) deacylase
MIPSSISDYLNRNSANYSVMMHPTAYTAQREAAAAHVPGSQWAKTVVCIADDQPVLAVVPASRDVDFPRLQRVLNAHSIRLAREAEFAELYEDCEVGAMPPLGPLYGQPVVVDKTLTVTPEIAFNGGSHHDAIRMPYREFERLVHPNVAEFAAGPSMASRQETVAWTDPVCGAEVLESQATAWSEYAGEAYYFCSTSCKMEFDDNPQSYSSRR